MRAITDVVTSLTYPRSMPFEQELPKALSPSRLGDFQSCPRKYQYASVERIPQPASYATAKGRFAHYVFEQLFALAPTERTIERARSYVQPAKVEILDEKTRSDIGMDEAMETKMTQEVEAIIDTYFTMEDPTAVKTEGIELRVGVDIDGAPIFGILDRLDREPDGSLVIVDYKTGSVPNRNYDTQTFANAELYAAMCVEKLGEKPSKIRLLYVQQGEALERQVSDVVIKARGKAAADAWKKITSYYAEGEFPATPSPNSCRFCSFKDRCRESGVPVPVR